MKAVQVVLLVLIVCYILYRFRMMEDKMSSFKRSLDSRLTDADIDGIVQLSHKHSVETLMTTLEEKVHSLECMIRKTNRIEDDDDDEEEGARIEEVEVDATG